MNLNLYVCNRFRGKINLFSAELKAVICFYIQMQV